MNINVYSNMYIPVEITQVDEVRTADDAPLRVKLMLFYELKEIETMVRVVIQVTKMSHNAYRLDKF